MLLPAQGHRVYDFSGGVVLPLSISDGGQVSLRLYSAPQTEVAVGVLNGCTYHGQSYFDLGALPNDTTIVSATLRLYTPGQMMATGVQVYQNAPLPDGTDPSAAPSWSNAPLVMTGTTGLAQTASDGHWQSWDVTSLVQGWVQNDATNGGVTLISSGAPVSFTSPLGAGTDSPALAPYLDITYSSTPSAHAHYYDDTANTIYGVSGSFTTQARCGRIACHGDITPSGVRAVNGGGGGSLMRIGVQLNCMTDTVNWNDMSKTGADFENGDTITHILQEAMDTTNPNGTPSNGVGVVPIIDFLIPNDSNCENYLGNPYSNPSYATHWMAQMKNFVDTMLQPLIPAYPHSREFMYFEIGNEQNLHSPAYFSYTTGSGPNYPLIFAAAAKGLHDEIAAKQLDPRVFSYRVLTGAMIEPTAAQDLSCENPQPNPGLFNEDVAVAAIQTAETQGLSASQLGLAVHPYNYSTNNTAYWRNFFHMYPIIITRPTGQLLFYNSYPGICRDLSGMLTTWTQDPRLSGQHLPLVFTEDNWSDVPQYPISLPAQFCGDPFGCAGAYLADLFTWLNYHDGQYHTLHPLDSPLRVAWYRGANKGSLQSDNGLLGLYRSGGQGERLDGGAENLPQSQYFPNTLAACIVHAANLNDLFNQLRHAACYAP